MDTNIIIQDNTNNTAEFSIVRSKIHEIRGQKVMLDFDLAEMYQVETKVLNQSVKRNIKRFPNDFMFQLTNEEFKILRSQIVTSSWGGARYQPYAFTEQGIAMLSGLLNSDIAINTNIIIMRAFVMLRQYVLNYAEVKQELDNFMRETNAKLNRNDMKFETIFKLFDEYMKQNKLYKERGQIGFKQK